jgi:hypothetical protein
LKTLPEGKKGIKNAKVRQTEKRWSEIFYGVFAVFFKAMLLPVASRGFIFRTYSPLYLKSVQKQSKVPL